MKYVSCLIAATLLLTSFTVQANIEEVTTPGGITAWLVEDHKLPLLNMHFAFRGGVEQDPEDQQGMSTLLAGLLTEGAGPYDAENFQQQLADHSISLGYTASRDAFYGQLKTLTSEKDKAFELLQLSLTAPRFDDADFDREGSQQLTAQRIEVGSPDWQARHALFQQVFANHPYSQRRLGTQTTLENITPDDLKDFVAAQFARDNLTIAVAGDITPAELATILDRIFGKLPAHAALAKIDDVTWPKEPATILIPRDGTQTELLFTEPAPKRDDPDWYAATIVDYILGSGGFSSRLMHEVRDKKGLTYGINTSLAPMEHAGIIVGEAATDNDKAGQAWDLVRQVWGDLYSHGVTDEEIKAAKDYLTGSLPLAMTSTSAIATVLVDIQLHNLGRDYLEKRNDLIRSVTDDDIQRVIKRWFDPDNLTMVMVGQPEGIKPTLTEDSARD